MTVPFWLFPPPAPRPPWKHRIALAALGLALTPPLVAATAWLTVQFLRLWMRLA